MGFYIENGVLTKYTQEPGVTEIVISDGVTEIGDDAFRNCTSLKNLTIPKSVTSIGNYAFYDCTSLSRIDVDENNTVFSSVDGVLYNKDKTELILCPRGAKNIAIPNSVKTIYVNAFQCCKLLVSISLSDSVASIGNCAFWNCTSLPSITLPNSVTTIKFRTFAYCTSLMNITLPSSATEIGFDAFLSCTSLETVTIPNNVISIGVSAFYRCTSLTSITIPYGVTEIEGCTFYDCISLKNITIPKSVTSIGDYAFYGCTSLTSITIPKSVTEIGHRAFGKCKLQYVYASIDSPIMSTFNSGSSLAIEMDKEKHRFYALSFKAHTNNYEDFIKTKLWNAYDMELLNNGPKYKYRLPARLFGGLDRLLNPVDLTDENKEMYIELLKKNVKKMIAIAEEINCPFAVKALFELGLIDESNAKAVKKLLLASALPEISSLAELLGNEDEKPKTKKAVTDL